MSKEPHTNHIVSFSNQLKVWIALLLLTWLTVTIAYIDFGNLTLSIALLIAVVKSTIVLAYFMHLKFDSKILTVFLILVIVIFAVFIGLTFFDYALR
ncbi:MAG: cytochrome C oxidase subunit IV family protein [Bacteroidales bacterium]|jgi:cytochrome c oxidase subunit 4|nr:cytochrome C oxidase subunit IV family protein [Bacteroidales bacterium]